jgi:hypothetical protein
MARPGTLEEFEAYVSSATGDIEKFLSGFWSQPIHHRFFPDTVYANTHHVIHNVVFAGHGGENTLHFAGLFGLWNGFKTKMGCVFTGVLHGTGLL